MVVPVLITSCQVSENLNIGPVIPQTIIINAAVIKAMGEPVALVTLLASFWNSLDSLLLRCIFFIACIVLSITEMNSIQEQGYTNGKQRTEQSNKKKSGQEWPDTSRP